MFFLSTGNTKRQPFALFRKFQSSSFLITDFIQCPEPMIQSVQELSRIHDFFLFTAFNPPQDHSFPLELPLLIHKSLINKPILQLDPFDTFPTSRLQVAPKSAALLV